MLFTDWQMNSPKHDLTPLSVISSTPFRSRYRWLNRAAKRFLINNSQTQKMEERLRRSVLHYRRWNMSLWTDERRPWLLFRPEGPGYWLQATLPFYSEERKASQSLHSLSKIYMDLFFTFSLPSSVLPPAIFASPSLFHQNVLKNVKLPQFSNEPKIYVAEFYRFEANCALFFDHWIFN